MTKLTNCPPTLTREERRLYGLLADLLIPAAEGMPSASAADVPGEWLQHALRARPDLAAGLRRALEVARDCEPAEALDRLADDDALAFEALGTLTAGGYLMNPDVRALIGYPGQTERPLSDDIETYIDLLKRVVERGPIYRESPP